MIASWVYYKLFNQFLTVLYLVYYDFLISESTGMNAPAAKFWHISLPIFFWYTPWNGIAGQGLCISSHFQDTFVSKLEKDLIFRSTWSYMSIQDVNRKKFLKRCWSPLFYLEQFRHRRLLTLYNKHILKAFNTHFKSFLFAKCG